MLRRLANVKLILLLGLVVACEASATRMPDHLPSDVLVVETASGERHAFRVRIASRLEDRRRGLMFVDMLDIDEGMLFDNGENRVASMWMKNTPLPLDMLFIRADGTISSIAEETVPFSRAPILSREPVIAVLEIRGGVSGQLGISAGDRAIHALFERPAD
jgi:uncharacterized membrane protein (UPF0127 family)